MEGGEKKASFSSSWADAVEREEQEEAQKQRKPNPFGAARPREVVLEEKGVDWRKLDQGLEKNNSVLREDGKKPKENIFSAPTVLRRVHEQNKPRPQNPSPLVPPIMYAPRNIMTLMEQIRKDRRDVASSSDVKSQSYVKKKKKPAVPAEENSSSRCRRRQVLVDVNAERANLENYRADMRKSFTCGDRKPEKTTSIRNCDGNRNSSSGRGLESEAGYGVRERVNSGDLSNRCVDTRGKIRMKRRASMAETGTRHERRQTKQSRK
ncbi:uncharacterized protein A4U43_C05F1450 [Asparagus officinalis]|uniref:Uncharacterized protein n=1 Tax=Asparagus officinalis TaxID=4686 RepID=A0A5P1EP66_ASPOF|nr:eukaryotic translation initiation factor 4B2-like [Asparagus officinalis]ONK67574.1 uncharacterized protein A4U43_C05F1450 [Asparagus officinalis]